MIGLRRAEEAVKSGRLACELEQGSSPEGGTSEEEQGLLSLFSYDSHQSTKKMDTNNNLSTFTPEHTALKVAIQKHWEKETEKLQSLPI